MVDRKSYGAHLQVRQPALDFVLFARGVFLGIFTCSSSPMVAELTIFRIECFGAVIVPCMI